MFIIPKNGESFARCSFAKQKTDQKIFKTLNNFFSLPFFSSSFPLTRVNAKAEEETRLS